MNANQITYKHYLYYVTDKECASDVEKNGIPKPESGAIILSENPFTFWKPGRAIFRVRSTGIKMNLSLGTMTDEFWYSGHIAPRRIQLWVPPRAQFNKAKREYYQLHPDEEEQEILKTRRELDLKECEQEVVPSKEEVRSAAKLNRKAITTNGRAAFYACLWPKIRETALKFGWGAALHGSLETDMDIIVLPWTEDASLFSKLVEEIALLFQDNDLASQYQISYKEACHGRIIATIPIWGDFYLDISTMPSSRTVEVLHDADSEKEEEESSSTAMKVKYDAPTSHWFHEHPRSETTVVQCKECGLFYRPSLGHKCRLSDKRKHSKKEERMCGGEWRYCDGICAHCSLPKMCFSTTTEKKMPNEGEEK